MEDKDLAMSVVKSMSYPKARDEFGSLIELGLDTFLADGLAKELPLISSFMTLYDAYIGIRDKLFMKRVIACLYEASNLSDEDRASWAQKIAADPVEARKAGEATLMLIEHLTSVEKASMVGRLLGAQARGLIDRPTYFRLAETINNAYLADLEEFGKADWSVTYPTGVRLASVGIMTPSGIKNKIFSQPLNIPTHRDGMNASDLSHALDEKLGNMVFDYVTSEDGSLILKLVFRPETDFEEWIRTPVSRFHY